MDSWEEGFDSWTPSRPDSRDETGTDLDREELLRLARELAERRQTPQAHGDAELEQLKQSLRERAEAIAARERELAELQRRLERPAGVRGRLEARRRARRPRHRGARRARARRARARPGARGARARARAGSAGRRARSRGRALAERERELAGELKAVEATLGEPRRSASSQRPSASGSRSATAQRTTVEKELAAARIELEAERQELDARRASSRPSGSARAQPAALETPRRASRIPASRARSRRALAAVELRERLADRESKLEASERELALVREDLDAERNALLERERATAPPRGRRGARSRFDAPFAPPSFSEGLAAFARSRPR